MSDDLIVDLTNYKDRVGSRVVPGRYSVIVEDAESDTAKSGNPMVNLWFRIQGGEFDGQTIVDRLVLTEKSLFRVVGFLQAIGVPTPKKRMKMNIRGFVGKRLDIDVEDGDPYNGRVKSEVRGYMRPVGGSSTKEEADLDDIETEATTGAAQPDAAPDVPAEEVSPPAEKSEDATPPPASSDIEDVDLDEIDLG